MTDDPTRIRSQPALTTSSGRIWLIVGGIFAVISLAVLIPMTSMPPPGVALTGACVVVALYAAMVITRLLVERRRLRLGLMAIFMLVMAAVALGCTLWVAWSTFDQQL